MSSVPARKQTRVDQRACEVSYVIAGTVYLHSECRTLSFRQWGGRASKDARSVASDSSFSSPSSFAAASAEVEARGGTGPASAANPASVGCTTMSPRGGLARGGTALSAQSGGGSPLTGTGRGAGKEQFQFRRAFGISSRAQLVQRNLRLASDPLQIETRQPRAGVASCDSRSCCRRCRLFHTEQTTLQRVPVQTPSSLLVPCASRRASSHRQ